MRLSAELEKLFDNRETAVVVPETRKDAIEFLEEVFARGRCGSGSRGIFKAMECKDPENYQICFYIEDGFYGGWCSYAWYTSHLYEYKRFISYRHQDIAFSNDVENLEDILGW